MPLSSEDQVKYKSLYLQTAREYIQELKVNLKKLRKGKVSTDVLDSLHRAAHSLKGQSLMMDYPAMSDISLTLEKIFQAKKDNKITFSEDTISLFDEAISQMEACLNAIDKSDTETDLSAFVEKLQKLV